MAAVELLGNFLQGVAALGDRLRLIIAKISDRNHKGEHYEEFEMPGARAAPTGGIDIPEPVRPPLRPIDMYVRAECPCLSQRYTVALLTCIGFVISFGMRCNMGMAKLGFEHHGKPVTNRNLSVDELKFTWSVGTESAVDSSFFWGYLITQVPGGFLSSLFPANRIFGTAIAISSFFNLLVPGAVSISPYIVILVRASQGFVEGVTYPACHGIWRFWAPPLERSRLATMAFCGSYAGIVLGMPLSGLLIGRISWQAPFYFYGMAGLIWYLFWLWLVFEKPCNHPTISAQEVYYIETSLGQQQTHVSMPTLSTTPFRAFLTSMPVHAIIVANFCRSWNFYLLVLYQASYLSTTFKFKIEETGFIGALPHLLMTIIVPCGGLLADNLRKKGILTTTAVRKLFNCGGFGCEAFFFLIVAHAHTAFTANFALTCGVALSGFAISGYNVNHLDIAPRYASILMGISNGIGTVAGLIVPIVIDHITENHDQHSWKIVFIMAAMVHFFGITFYGIFASGELQPWAEPPPDDSDVSNKMVPPRPPAPGQETTETSLTANVQSTISYGTVSGNESNPTNPFKSWGDEGANSQFQWQQQQQQPQQQQPVSIPPPRSNPFQTTSYPVQPSNLDYSNMPVDSSSNQYINNPQYQQYQQYPPSY